MQEVGRTAPHVMKTMETIPPTEVDALIARYRSDFSTLVRLAFLLVDDRAEAIRVVDDAFVRVASARGRPRAPFSMGDLRRAVLAGARDRAVPSTGRGAPAAEGIDPIVVAFRTLPFVQRAALVLHHVGALSDDDIAHAADAPIADVRAHAAAGLRSLEAALGAPAR